MVSLNRTKLRLFIFLTLISFSPVLMSQNHFFVSPAGDDVNGTGTFQNPFNTVTKAAQVAQNYDAIEVLPGTYNESININNKSYLKIYGVSRDSCIFLQPLVLSNFAQYNQFRKLSLAGFRTGNYQYCYKTLIDSCRITGEIFAGIHGGTNDFTNNEITGSLRLIMNNYGFYNNFINNHIYGNGEGIEFNGGGRYLILNNIFENLSLAIKSQSHFEGTHWNYIANNTFINCSIVFQDNSRNDANWTFLNNLIIKTNQAFVKYVNSPSFIRFNNIWDNSDTSLINWYSAGYIASNFEENRNNGSPFFTSVQNRTGHLINTNVVSFIDMDSDGDNDIDDSVCTIGAYNRFNPLFGVVPELRGDTIKWTFINGDKDQIRNLTAVKIQFSENSDFRNIMYEVEVADKNHYLPVFGTGKYFFRLQAKDNYDVFSNWTNGFDSLTISNGLIAYYKLNGETSDHTQNSNHGSTVGSIIPSTDRFGNPSGAMYFDGNGSYVLIPNSPSLNSPGSGITLAGWIQIEDFPGIRVAGLINKTVNSAYGQYGLNYQSWAESGVGFAISGGTQGIFARTHFLRQRWYFVCATFDGNYLKVYSNGSLVQSVETAGIIVPDNNPVVLGLDSPGQNEFLQGSLDDIRIYNRALSQSEILNLYHENGYAGFIDSIHITSPAFNDTLAGDFYGYLEWETSFTSGSGNLAISTNNGMDWYSIASDVPLAQKFYKFIVPDIESQDCLLNLVDYESKVFGVSEKFTIRKLNLTDSVVYFSSVNNGYANELRKIVIGKSNSYLLYTAPQGWNIGEIKASPDGRKIAFKMGSSGWDDELWLVNSDGSMPKKLTALAWSGVFNWIKGSDEIVIRGFNNGNADIFKLSAENGSSVHWVSASQFTPFSRNDIRSNFTWTTDKSKVLCIAGVGGSGWNETFISDFDFNTGSLSNIRKLSDDAFIHYRQSITSEMTSDGDSVFYVWRDNENGWISSLFYVNPLTMQRDLLNTFMNEDIFKLKITNHNQMFWAGRNQSDNSGTKIGIMTKDGRNFYELPVDIDRPYFFDVSSEVSESSIRLLSHMGGETKYSGFQDTIFWSSLGIGSVNIKLSIDNGINWSSIVDSVSASTGYAVWNIPFSYTNDAKIKIVSLTDSLISDLSDSVFSIISPNPVLNNPPNTIAGVSTEPTFGWNKVEFAVKYILKLSTSLTNFEDSLVFVDSSVSLETTSVSYSERTKFGEQHPFPLRLGTVYFWKIGAVRNDGSVFYSAINSFRTFPEFSIYTVTPVNGGSLIPYTNVAFTYYTLGQYSGFKYKLQVKPCGNVVSPDPDFWLNAPIVSVSSNLSQILNIYGGTRYFWRIMVLRESNNDVLAYSGVQSFTTLGGAQIPNCSYPVNLVQVYTLNPTLNWYLAGYLNELSFSLQISSVASDSGEILHSVSDLTTLSYTVPTSVLNPQTIYYWRVRSKFIPTGIESDYSEWASFRTGNSGDAVRPVILYPSQNAVLYSSNPDLYWYINGSGNGLMYRIQIDSTPVFQNPAEYSGINITSYKVFGLTPGKSYWWRVKSYTHQNPNGSSWSDVAGFSLNGGLGITRTITVYPIGNPLVYSLTPIVNWYCEGSYTGVTGYTIKWVKNTNEPDDWENTLCETRNISGQYNLIYTFTADDELANGDQIYWAVSAKINGVNSPFWSSGSFRINSGSGTEAPILVNPVNNYVFNSSEVNLEWFINGAVGGISGYQLTISRSENFDSSNTMHYYSSASSHHLSNLIHGTIYWWKVRAIYGNNGPGEYSNPTGCFTIDLGTAGVVTPIVGSPKNVTIATNAPVLSWTSQLNLSPNLLFSLEVSNNPDFNDPLIFSSIQGLSKRIDALEEQKYYWRIRSLDTAGNISNYSSKAWFIINTNPSAVDKDGGIPLEFRVFQNFPNPFNPITNVSFVLPESGHVKLIVFNSIGEIVSVLLNEYFDAGLHSVQFNSHGLPSGVYFYSLQQGPLKAVKKMIILK